ncbi:hypothetical protein, conserved, partial [Eimeria acervulina]
AFIESLGLVLDLLYVPAVGLTASSTCFNASGSFSNLLSLQPSEQQPPPATATALLQRGRSNYSLIQRISVERYDDWITGGDDPTGDNPTGGGGDPTGADPNGGDPTRDPANGLPLVHVVLPRFDSRLKALVEYDSAAAAAAAGVSFSGVGPTLLISNAVPFIAGLRVGVNVVSLYIGVNLPLETGDKALKEAIERDCKERQLLYFQLRAPVVSARSMLLQVSHQPFAYTTFAAPCTLKTAAAGQWPPETPETFITQREAYALESASLIMEGGYA